MNTHTAPQNKPTNRHRGLTTRRAVAFLNKTLENPGTPVTIHDHHNTLVAHVRLTQTVSELLHFLLVEHIVDGNVITVKPISEVTA